VRAHPDDLSSWLSQIETCFRLSPVNGSRFHPPNARAISSRRSAPSGPARPATRIAKGRELPKASVLGLEIVTGDEPLIRNVVFVDSEMSLARGHFADRDTMADGRRSPSIVTASISTTIDT
jgi:hypothetical protein